MGYDISGSKVGKTISHKSEIDKLLAKHDDPDNWRKITDLKNQEEIRLSDRDLEVIHRIRRHRLPYASTNTEEMVEYDNPDAAKHPTGGNPFNPPKHRFLPSKWEKRKIYKLVRLYREGKLSFQIKAKEEERKKREGQGEVVFLRMFCLYGSV